MSMTRKDYIIIAEALVTARGPLDDIDRLIVDRAACYIADALAADNPRFDRERFITAATQDKSTYKITRFFQGKPGVVIATGYTLAQAQAHCQDETTHGPDWFDGYDEES